jgi:hypothetical protein
MKTASCPIAASSGITINYYIFALSPNHLSDVLFIVPSPCCIPIKQINIAAASYIVAARAIFWKASDGRAYQGRNQELETCYCTDEHIHIFKIRLHRDLDLDLMWV